VRKKLLLIAIVIIGLSRPVVGAAELPSYELMGFPITPHQLLVLEPANIKEQLPSPSLTIAGMPASPHQVSVLARRDCLQQALQVAP
jgi:hypothetical protein